MKSNTKNALTVAAAFNVQWPTELDIKPKFEFDISKGVIARVYEKMVDHHDRNGNPIGTKTVYVVDFVSKATGLWPRGLGDQRYATCVHGDFLEVRQYIERCAGLLRPKTKTVRIEEDLEE